MPKVDYVYFDSCVLIACFNVERGRVEILDQLFEEILNDNTRKIVTSVYSIVEVANLASEKKQARLDPLFEEKLDLFWSNTELLTIIDFHELLAKKARNLMRQVVPMKYSLKAGDAVHLVSAQAVGVHEFFTYDDLGKYADFLGFRILEPYVSQPRLLP